MSRTPWVPYKIPPIVERENPSDVYALGWDHDLADSYDGDPTATNPTQFLKWKKVEASRSTHPFAVYLQTNQNGTVQARVESDSIIYTGIGTYSSHNISGLNTFVNAVQGYVTVSASVSNGIVSSGFSLNWGSSSTNRANASYVEARIAYLYSVNGGGWEVIQMVFGNMTTITGCYNGDPIVYLVQT